MSKLFLSAILGLLISSIGFGKELTFEEFQESCQNPEAYGHQNPPDKIKLLCHDVYNGWQPVESGTVQLSESRLISGEIFSNKYHVSTSDFDVTMPERNAVCPRFREVVQTATVEIALTCAQVTAEGASLKDMCRTALDNAINENPDIVESRDSGRTFSVCGDATQKP